MSGLSDCERASYYILIQQPGVKASDISTESMPQLHSWLNGTASKQLETTSVPEVVGEWDLEQVAERISDICNLDVWRHEAILKLIKTPRAALYLSLPEVKGDERSKRLADTGMCASSPSITVRLITAYRRSHQHHSADSLPRPTMGDHLQRIVQDRSVSVLTTRAPRSSIRNGRAVTSPHESQARRRAA